MPSEQPSPEEIIVFVKPYVRKYVVARLSDPERLMTDEASRQLHVSLERELRGRTLLAVVNDFDPDSDSPSTRLRLVVTPRKGQPAQISHYHHRYVTALLTKAFLREMFHWVDWYRQRLGMSTGPALDTFRRHYGITEEDHHLETARRMYSFHMSGRKRKRRTKARR